MGPSDPGTLGRPAVNGGTSSSLPASSAYAALLDLLACLLACLPPGIIREGNQKNMGRITSSALSLPRGLAWVEP